MGLRREGCVVLGVDFDPEVVADWHIQGWPAHYGDAEDPEMLGSLPLTQVRWIISGIPSYETNRTLLHALRTHRYTERVAVTAHTIQEAEHLKQYGADVVFLPFVDAAERAVGSADPSQPFSSGEIPTSPWLKHISIKFMHQ